MAAPCSNYCDDDPIGAYDTNSCGDDLGGISAFLILECAHQLTNPSSANQINAEIAAGRAHLVKRASLSVDAPSPVLSDSLVPCEGQSLTTYNRKGSYKNPNISATNVDFHNRIFDGRKFGGLLLYECSTADDSPRVSWIDEVVLFTGGRIIPGTNTEFQRFEGEFSYQSRKNPYPYAAPAGIFE